MCIHAARGVRTIYLCQNPAVSLSFLSELARHTHHPRSPWTLRFSHTARAHATQITLDAQAFGSSTTTELLLDVMSGPARVRLRHQRTAMAAASQHPRAAAKTGADIGCKCTSQVVSTAEQPITKVPTVCNRRARLTSHCSNLASTCRGGHRGGSEGGAVWQAV